MLTRILSVRIGRGQYELQMDEVGNDVQQNTTFLPAYRHGPRLP